MRRGRSKLRKFTRLRLRLVAAPLPIVTSPVASTPKSLCLSPLSFLLFFLALTSQASAEGAQGGIGEVRYQLRVRRTAHGLGNTEGANNVSSSNVRGQARNSVR